MWASIDKVKLVSVYKGVQLGTPCLGICALPMLAWNSREVVAGTFVIGGLVHVCIEVTHNYESRTSWDLANCLIDLVPSCLFCSGASMSRARWG